MKNAIVDSPKGFRRIKFANIRYFDKRKGLSTRGSTYFAYIYPTKLRIVRLKWSSGFKNNSSDFITITYKRGNFLFSSNGKSVSFNSFFSIFNKNFKLTVRLRLQKIIAQFSENLGHTYKKSKNPDERRIFSRLFWPSLQKMNYNGIFTPSRIKPVGSLLRRYLTLKEIIREILGSCGNKTYRLICEKIKEDGITSVLDKLYIFSKILRIDDIQLILTRPGYERISASGRMYNEPQLEYKIVQYLKQFSKTRLLSDKVEDFNVFFYDSVHMWHNLGKPPVRKGISLNEHHEILSREGRKAKYPNLLLNPAKELLQIDGLQVEDYTIVVPKTGHELAEWSSIMSNCISGYASHMSQRKTNLFGVKQGDELVYNVMIDSTLHKDIIGPNYILTQFYGKYNSRVNPKIVRTILNALPFKVFDAQFSI